MEIFLFSNLNRTRNFHFFFTTSVTCITGLGKAFLRQVYIAIGIYFKSILTLTATKLQEM